MSTPSPPGDAEVLRPEDIEQADARYGGFPPFHEWLACAGQEELWAGYARTLEEEKTRATADVLRTALDSALKMAAVDTGAIEGLYSVDRGFTMTVATRTAAWEAQIEQRQAEGSELIKAQLEAYELVLDAATNDLPISEAWIRRLHEATCAAQDMFEVVTPVGRETHKLPKGEYKGQPNHVRKLEASQAR